MSFGDLKLHGHYDIFFTWCKPKWSRDEFNNQSHIYMALGQLHGPWCEQPLKHLLPLSGGTPLPLAFIPNWSLV